MKPPASFASIGASRATKVRLPYAQRSGLMSALLNSCRRGDLSAVKNMLEDGAPFDVKDQDGGTPLHLASKGGHTGVAALLIEKGAPLDATTEVRARVVTARDVTAHIETMQCDIGGTRRRSRFV